MVTKQRIGEFFAMPNAMAASVLAVGIGFAGYHIGASLVAMQEASRSVTVRGLNEREVKADLGVWPMRLKAADNDLVIAQTSLETQKQSVLNFLDKHGISKNEISVFGQRVTDKLANEYGGNQGGFRYIVQATVQVRTHDVERLDAAAADAGELLKNGVTLSDDGCSGGPDYSFTKLNEIKPAMLAEATANAREAAQQFAQDSGSELGGIRRATQGYFSIAARDSVEENSGGNYGCVPSSIDKRVRVVTTVEYSLND